MTKEYVYLAFFMIFVTVAGNFILNGGYVRKGISCGKYQTQEILFGDKKVTAEVSNDDCKRLAGLSGRKDLDKDTGMLFIFDDEEGQGIWMKDMNFPIDIVWVNASREIVLAKKNIMPETYPKIFGDDVISKYAIELPSGFVETNNIQIGDRVLF